MREDLNRVKRIVEARNKERAGKEISQRQVEAIEKIADHLEELISEIRTLQTAIELRN